MRWQRRAERQLDLHARAGRRARVVGQEGGTAVPREPRIGVPDRERHDRDAEPERDAEPAAPERQHAIPGGRRPLREAQHRRARREQIVHPAQGAGPAGHRAALDEHDAEGRADGADQRPARDLTLGQRDRRAHRQDRQRIQVADVVGHHEGSAPRHRAAHLGGKAVRAADPAERAGQPMRGGAGIARRRGAGGAQLGERAHEAAPGVPREVERAQAATAGARGRSPRRSYFGRSSSNASRSIFDTIRSSPGP